MRIVPLFGSSEILCMCVSGMNAGKANKPADGFLGLSEAHLLIEEKQTSKNYF